MRGTSDLPIGGCAALLDYSCLGLARTIHLYVYTVYIRYFWQGTHHTYGHIRCRYTILANPIHVHSPAAELAWARSLALISYTCVFPVFKHCRPPYFKKAVIPRISCSTSTCTSSIPQQQRSSHLEVQAYANF